MTERLARVRKAVINAASLLLLAGAWAQPWVHGGAQAALASALGLAAVIVHYRVPNELPPEVEQALRNEKALGTYQERVRALREQVPPSAP